jgi:hypothetical protein
MTDQQRTILRDTILTLSNGCPLDQANSIACPLHDARRLPLEQRMDWLFGLKDAELNYLVAYHFDCQKRRGEFLKRHPSAQ